MRARVVPSLMAASALALAPAAAGAAAPWSTPQDVSSPATFIDAPALSFAASGTALASWTAGDKGPNRPVTSEGRAAARASGSAVFGSERALPGIGAPLTYARNRALLVFRGPDRLVSSGDRRSTITAAFGRADGLLGAPRPIADAFAFTPLASAVSRDGDAIAAWIDASADARRRIVRVSLRRPGRGFGRASTIAGRGRANALTAAVDARGDSVVAWEGEGVIRVRVRRAGRFGPIQSLGSAARGHTRLVSAMAGGRAYVAWASQALSEGGTNGPFMLQAATLGSGAQRFHAPQTLDRFAHRLPDQDYPGPRIALTGRTALLGWTGFDGSRFRARTATTSVRGRFGAAQDISPAGRSAVLGDVAAAPGGATLAVWSLQDAFGELGDRVQAALRPGLTTAYGPPEDVSDSDRARLPAAAFDPRTGRPTVVWSQRVGPDGPGVPIGQIHTYARAAERIG